MPSRILEMIKAKVSQLPKEIPEPRSAIKLGQSPSEIPKPQKQIKETKIKKNKKSDIKL
jgi:hypothetical protein